MLRRCGEEKEKQEELIRVEGEPEAFWPRDVVVGIDCVVLALRCWGGGERILEGNLGG
jgi:hypothetical protein